jgi:hypothetical protein
VGHPAIAAYARMADGSAKAIRTIAGQNTLITRDIHDMGYDSSRDEIVTMQAQAFAITTFKGDADGDVAPIRTIMGPKTGLLSAKGRLALDSVNHEIFVPDDTKVQVFPQLANGDVAPIRVLEGPNTLLGPNGATAATVDPVHNLLIVTGRAYGRQGATPFVADIYIKGKSGLRDGLEGGSVGQIAIFDRSASGNTKPLRVITGSKTGLSSPQTLITTYSPKGWILAAVWGSEFGEIGTQRSARSFVGVWSIYDDGDVPPRWTIGGPNGFLQQARGVTLDPANKVVIVSDKYHNGVFSFEFPELF